MEEFKRERGRRPKHIIYEDAGNWNGEEKETPQKVFHGIVKVDILDLSKKWAEKYIGGIDPYKE